MSVPASVLTVNLNNGAHVLADEGLRGVTPVLYHAATQYADATVEALRAFGVNANLLPAPNGRGVYVEVLPSDDVVAITGPDDMRYYVPVDGCQCGEVLCSGEGHTAKGGA
jgi:hypothetical protein